MPRNDSNRESLPRPRAAGGSCVRLLREEVNKALAAVGRFGEWIKAYSERLTVAKAGGWKTPEVVARIYQQADSETTLKVVLHMAEVSEVAS